MHMSVVKHGNISGNTYAHCNLEEIDLVFDMLDDVKRLALMTCFTLFLEYFRPS